MINNLPPFAFQPVLPAVFDDSLSYAEMIAKLYEQVQVLTDAVNKVDIDAVTKALADLKIYVNSRDANIISTLQSKITALSNKEQADYENLSADIDDLIAKINAVIASIDAKITIALTQYDQYIKGYIDLQLLDVKVVNYFTGATVTIQEMVNYLAQLHATNGLTYDAMIARNYTYDEMIAICSAGNYDYTDIVMNANTIFPVK